MVLRTQKQIESSLTCARHSQVISHSPSYKIASAVDQPSIAYLPNRFNDKYLHFVHVGKQASKQANTTARPHTRTIVLHYYNHIRVTNLKQHSALALLRIQLPDSRTQNLQQWYHAAKRYEKIGRPANSRHSTRSESSPVVQRM